MHRSDDRLTYLIVLFVVEGDLEVVKSLEEKVNVPEGIKVDDDF